MSTVDVPLGPITPRCAAHPEEAATSTCTRCGTFICAQCVRRISGQALCATCADRPEFNYLERLRLKLWGRRDGAAWMAGAFSLGLTAITVGAVWKRWMSWVLVLAMAACAVASMAFFLGKRRAREALIGTTLVCSVAFLAFRAQGGSVFFLMACIFALLISFNTRNRLFFQQQVSTARLQRLWHVTENNPRARDALNLGFASVAFPLFAPLAILLGVVALQRVDPHSTPPIGRKGQAIAAIVLGTLCLVLWGLLLTAIFGGSSSGEDW